MYFVVFLKFFGLKSVLHFHGRVNWKIPLEADVDFLSSRAHQAILMLCGCVKEIAQNSLSWKQP